MSFSRPSRRWAAAAFLVGAAQGWAPASPVPKPIEFGISRVVKSRALSEDRVVNVLLPLTYAKFPKRQYPVLYLIDGGVDQDLVHIAGVARLGAMWGRSGDAIIVGIETKDRRRELVGPTADPELLRKYPTAGASAKFRDFIRLEVKPLIELSYRTNGKSAVMGELLAGLFVVETYLLQPALFDAYGAIDPSLWWDKEALSKLAGRKLDSEQKGRTLFLAFAKEQLEEPAASVRLRSALEQKALAYCAEARPDLTHATIYQQVSPQALQYLLPPSDPAPPEFGFSLDCDKQR